MQRLKRVRVYLIPVLEYQAKGSIRTLPVPVASLGTSIPVLAVPVQPTNTWVVPVLVLWVW